MMGDRENKDRRGGQEKKKEKRNCKKGVYKRVEEAKRTRWAMYTTDLTG
jgi:hypothetical protein